MKLTLSFTTDKNKEPVIFSEPVTPEIAINLLQNYLQKELNLKVPSAHADKNTLPNKVFISYTSILETNDSRVSSKVSVILKPFKVKTEIDHTAELPLAVVSFNNALVRTCKNHSATLSNVNVSTSSQSTSSYQPTMTRKARQIVVPGTAYDYLWKVLFLGDSDVGKTSLINRCAKDIFSNTEKTDFRVRTENINGKRVTLQLWQTIEKRANAQKREPLFRGAHVTIICFDLTSQKSFNNLKTWLKTIDPNATNFNALYLVGTKSDLPRKVNDKDISALCAKNPLISGVFVTSAKTGDGVKDAMQVIAKNQQKMVTKKHADEVVGSTSDANSSAPKPSPFQQFKNKLRF